MTNTAGRDVREVIREEPLMHGPILATLAQGPLTVPEIAASLNRRSEEVMYWVMGMRRYGKVVELREPTDDGFFQYDDAKREVRS